MAKPLTKPQPESSIDRLLDKSVALSVVAPIEELEIAAAPVTKTVELPAQPRPKPLQKIAGEIKSTPRPGHATGEPAKIPCEFILTPTAKKTVDDLISIFKSATGTELTRSHVLRAVLMIIKEALPNIKAEAKHIGPLKRPSNAVGAEAERDEFERQLALAFKAGMRG